MDRYSAMRIRFFLGVYKTMTKEEILSLARELGDMTVDNRRRIDFCFDDHGIIAFANAIRNKALAEVGFKDDDADGCSDVFAAAIREKKRE